MLEVLDRHPHARAVLRGAVPPEGHASHAYLFHGPAGAGKREAARAFAAELPADRSAAPRADGAGAPPFPRGGGGREGGGRAGLAPRWWGPAAGPRRGPPAPAAWAGAAPTSKGSGPGAGGASSWATSTGPWCPPSATRR